MKAPGSSRRQTLGRWGETKAAEYLAGKGYEILSRNFRTPYGEIDIVARIDHQLVFVEVKTRASLTLGNPELSVTPRKQRHLLDSAQAYLQQYPDHQEDWRVDVIAIRNLAGGIEPEIIHFENALS